MHAQAAPVGWGTSAKGCSGRRSSHAAPTTSARASCPASWRGTQFWCQGYSEPGAGSDLANVRTRAEQDADGTWRVAGQKVWTSLAHDSDWIFVLARTDPASKGNKGLSFLLMPLDQPGIEIRPIKQLNGGAEFNEVFFDGARAQARDLVGAPGDGWGIAMTLLGLRARDVDARPADAVRPRARMGDRRPRANRARTATRCCASGSAARGPGFA
ncbi:acyl-CoA dehydrogenase family protein [Burkholderia contaminans]|uniref:acyl-CoA dehydrogenase family protein n=1 Tax=Burkholderia contaminans TaxID=488447 RepID=UPI003855BBCB